MTYYIKTFRDVYEDEQNPNTLVWKKGEYYKILKETEKRVYCDNEYQRKLLEEEMSLGSFIPKAWLSIRPIEKVKDRLPLDFIKLSEEEVEAEKEKKLIENP